MLSLLSSKKDFKMIKEQPKHPKTLEYSNAGLFKGLSRFEELEKRIAALQTKKARGDAFEVFAEAYLATQPLVNAQTVWPFEEIPLKLRKELALDTGIDMGVDGIFQNVLGEYEAYQVKFRTGRKSLTWNELSTFIGLTDKLKRRVLFTNSERLPSVLEDRTGFYVVRSSDLERLTQEDFTVIESWLGGKSISKKKKNPKPHQKEAIADILNAFKSEGRATTLMACGTGKTLVALWVAERLGYKSILVLLPSLALLRQTLHEWFESTTWERVSYVCVCSDPTVTRNHDDIIIRQLDLNFPVTTDSKDVKTFLEHGFDGVKVIFSTYQSSQVVAAGMNKGLPFELGIFDEAHKTAGRDGTKLSFALKNHNLPIKKRLFMTATPRHYNINKKDKEGNAKLVFSMDVPESYGKVVHKLSFVKAAQLGIICDYKIIISIVDSDMVTSELLKNGEVIVDGDVIRAKYVANQIALQKAVEKYGIKKVFTFHNTVKSAELFTNPGGESIINHLPDFEAFHVSGKMNTAVREKYMKGFRSANKGIMSNARCLIEGVDVPTVDMVGFLSPKKSKVDIVQATGRAMRLSADQNKTMGYILVPLFVQQRSGESIDEALDRTDFGDIWNVLQAMKEQDEILAETIHKMREKQGSLGGYDDGKFKEKVEFIGPELTLNALRESITARCVRQLSSSWDEMYGRLVRYKEIHGHTIIGGKDFEDKKFAKWARTQRTNAVRGLLSQKRWELLKAINYDFQYYDAKWESRFNMLTEYKQTFGHTMVPRNHPELGIWVKTQRERMRKLKTSIKSTQSILREEQVARLNNMGFVWEAYKDQWWEGYNAIKRFYDDMGGPFPVDKKKFYEGVNIWMFSHIQRQRRFYTKVMPDEEIRLLDGIGFIWEPLKDDLCKNIRYFKSFVKQYGHCKVKPNSLIGKFLKDQRRLMDMGELTEGRVEFYSEICPDWYQPN
ncbi:MAG: hypothetical protein C4522_10650 [Desulfobacteraceae bacterium]|nr:MAG: hypothetical protein C4522_10650 [Desulfobacteraceae bacterium]